MARVTGLVLVLTVSAVLDAGNYADPVIGLPLSGLTIAAVVISGGERFAWRMQVDNAILSERILVVVVSLLVLGVATILRQSRVSLAAQNARLAQAERALLHTLDTNMHLQEYAVSREDLAADEERKRITRDIHDTVGHTLMSIILMMQAAGKVMKNGDDGVRQFLEQTETQARNGMEETRRALRVLRATVGARPSLVARLNRLAHAFERTFLRLDIEYQNIPLSFNPEIDSIVLRVVQEAITNSIRHGGASVVDIHFWLEGGMVRVTINDNGRGCEEWSPGIGLCGIQERLSQVGGTLEVPPTDQGFSLVAMVPVETERRN
jgi:signal transduction histidine kinase